MPPWFELPLAKDAGWLTAQSQPIAIVGAGLAGLWVARNLLMTREPSDAERFYAAALDCLFDNLNELNKRGGYHDVGALQLLQRPYANRSDGFENLSADAAAIKAGIELNSAALFFARAGWVSVKALCSALFDDVIARGATFHREHALQELQYQQGCWQLRFSNHVRCRHQQVVLANGAALANIAQLHAANLVPARGQVSAFQRSFPLKTVITGKHYAIPDTDKVWIGATFVRGDEDASCQDADDRINRDKAAQLLPSVHTQLGPPLQRFAGVRCTTIDRYPVVGPVPDFSQARRLYADIHHGRKLNDYAAPAMCSGLAVVGGLGSRGLVVAPYAAQLLTDWICGGETLQNNNRLVSPIRFLIRQLKRQTTS